MSELVPDTGEQTGTYSIRDAAEYVVSLAITPCVYGVSLWDRLSSAAERAEMRGQQ